MIIGMILLIIPELNIRYLSFDPVKDKELEKIRSIFPRATIERKQSEFLLSDDEDSSTLNKGESFDASKLSQVENCTKAIKQYYALFVKRNDYFKIDSLGFFERLSNTKYSYNNKILADGTNDGVCLMSHNLLFQRNEVNYPKHKTMVLKVLMSMYVGPEIGKKSVNYTIIEKDHVHQAYSEKHHQL